MSGNPTAAKDTIKFWTFLTIILLAVAVTVTLIDLTIKASILAESNSMKLAMEEWEVRNGQKVSGRAEKGNPANSDLNGHFRRDVLDSDDAGLEARSIADGDQKPSASRARNRNKPSASNGD